MSSVTTTVDGGERTVFPPLMGERMWAWRPMAVR